jgi:hypothetical protein
MVQNGSVAGSTPLYALYRKQLVCVADNRSVNGAVAATADNLRAYGEFSCRAGGANGRIHFNTSEDIADPTKRAMTFPADRTQLANDPQQPTLLLDDVISFEVRGWERDHRRHGTWPNEWEGGWNDFTESNYKSYDSNSPGYRLDAIKIVLRVWDLKTQQARQITIFQDM